MKKEVELKMDYNDIMKQFIAIEEAHILANRFEIYIANQVIKINILKDLNNNSYSYANSHNYHGTEQSGPYMSSACSLIASEEEALERALQEITQFYDENDSGGKWVENELF